MPVLPLTGAWVIFSYSTELYAGMLSHQEAYRKHARQLSVSFKTLNKFRAT